MNTTSTPVRTRSINDHATRTEPARPVRDRNVAIDAYRAAAMLAVAFGHWLAADVRVGPSGLQGANALDQLRPLHFLTWIFQVMPLFFCIGGYSNAASLDAHAVTGGSTNAWVLARLRRLAGPAAQLAGLWFILLIASSIVGSGSATMRIAAGVAAIPLWFLANYVVDTAVAPVTLRWFRERPVAFCLLLVAAFSSLEVVRCLGIGVLPQGNIVIGWMLFQVLGFAWRDGRLDRIDRPGHVGALLLAIAAFLVALGPWPLAMVSVPGDRFANTWPPSLALVTFGLGYCLIAIAAAPRISRFLLAHPVTLRAVVVGNVVAMASYLWHFTALAVAAAIGWKLGVLPTATVGSMQWWVQKLPLLFGALAVLVGIIAVLLHQERRSVARPHLGDDGSQPTRAAPSTRRTISSAVALAAGFEIWTAAHGHRGLLLLGSGLVILTAWSLPHHERSAGSTGVRLGEK